ncbi:MAG: phosphate acyltransferase, partial [Pseudohongiellaceae bacterium]
MGGDCGVSVTVPASVRALQKHSNLQLDLVGDKNLISPLLQDVPQPLVSRLRLIHSAQRIPAGKRPQSVLRASRDSSLYLAVDLVKQGKVGAMVSAGDTGALL